jgi:hypothetical protein
MFTYNPTFQSANNKNPNPVGFVNNHVSTSGLNRTNEIRKQNSELFRSGGDLKTNNASPSGLETTNSNLLAGAPKPTSPESTTSKMGNSLAMYALNNAAKNGLYNNSR